MHGSCVPSPSEHRELLKVIQVGEEEEASAREVPRSMLTQIIQPRLEETFELVRAHLEASGLAGLGGRVVVLTGGASQLQGARELAETILDRQVRHGFPRRIRGLADATSGPAFATCAGMLRYAVQHHVETPHTDTAADEVVATGALGRLARWWKENF
jgi:cell division protein FtsA